MDFLVSVLKVSDPGLNFIGQLIRGIYEGVGNFGVTIILFTLILKAITLPIEYWQRSSSYKNAQKMKQMKPMIEKIDKAYGDNKRGAQAEKNKLYKKYGYSMVAGCIPSLITMAIFIFMMFGLSSYTAHTNAMNFDRLQSTYYEEVYSGFKDDYADKYRTEIIEFAGKYSTDKHTIDPENLTDAEIEAFLRERTPDGEPVFGEYEELIRTAAQTVGKLENKERKEKDGFLWIKNIWRPDTWEKVMPDYNQFNNGTLGMTGIKGVDKGEYEIIYDGVIKEADAHGSGGWNGLLILPLLSLVTQFFSMRISMRTQAGMGAQAAVNTGDPAMQSQKMMMWMMPVMMTAFSLFYTASFALYISCNAILSIISNLLMTLIIKRRYKDKEIKIVDQVSYRR